VFSRRARERACGAITQPCVEVSIIATDSCPSKRKSFADADILRRALPSLTFDLPEKPQTELTNFTTEPKTRRYLTRGAFISAHRAVDFMETLYRKGLKECSWKTLRYEFVQTFQTNDPKTLDKYLGHPEETVRSSAQSMVRQNRNSGTVAHFMYSNQRVIKAKKGLLEDLGYVTREGNRYILHHENFGYSTEQVTLETAIPLPEVNEESKQSNDNLRTRSLLGENDNQPILQGKGNGETVLEVSPIEEVVAERKEEEDIDSTHVNQSSESDTDLYTAIKNLVKPGFTRNDDKLERALGHKP